MLHTDARRPFGPGHDVFVRTDALRPSAPQHKSRGDVIPSERSECRESVSA